MPQHSHSLARIACAASVVLGVAGPASASGDQAWAEFDARVTRSCLTASGFRNGRPSTIIGFNDRVGTVAMLVSDRTRGSSQAKLCLYNKRAQRAYVDEAEMWSAPPQRP